MTSLTEPTTGPRPSALARFAALQRRVPVAQMVLVVLLFAYGAATKDNFTSYSSISSLLVLAAFIGLASLGQTLVVLLGGIDLSVSGFIVAGAVIVTQLSTQYGMSFPVAFAMLTVGSLFLGGLVGWVCHRFSIQPLIATLAMGSIALGLIQIQTGGAMTGTAPLWLSKLSSPVSRTFGLPISPVVAIWAVVAVLTALFLQRTVTGRRIYYTGVNRRAADLALVPTRRIWTAVFAFSAFCSAATGVLLAGYAGSVNGSLGGPYLFQSLTAVIVGGTVLGGPGDYWRSCLGAVILVLLTTLLIGMGFPQASREVLFGIVVLAAMALYGREKRLGDRI